MNEVSRGIVAGLIGTSAMTATLAADKLAGGFRGEPPPRAVGRRAEEAVGVRGLTRPAFEASWVAQHFAYGAAAGVAYELAWRRLGLAEPVPAGPAFGAALWAFGYAGWLPWTGLYPPPTGEPPRRVASLIAHHLVYGTAVALAAALLRRAR